MNEPQTMTALDRSWEHENQPTINRLTALFLTIPGWQRNFTSTEDAAKWVVREAGRVGWVITVADDKT